MTSQHDDIRKQLQELVALLRPYSQGAGPFADIDELRATIRLARHLIDRAEIALIKNGGSS